MSEVKRKHLASETITARNPSLDDEAASVILLTDGQSPWIGVLLASLSALISLSAIYLFFVWFTYS